MISSPEKVVVVNSPLFDNEVHSAEDSLPPLGLGYILTQLKREGIGTKFIDSIRENLDAPKIIDQLESLKPDFLLMNIFSTNYTLVKKIIHTISFRPHLILGGPAVKFLANKISKWEIDFKIDIVIGDGELITIDLIKNNLKEAPLAEHGDKRIFNINQSSIYYVRDISNILLDHTLINDATLNNVYGLKEIPLVSSRGCVFDCSFCASARSLNKDLKIRERSESSIINELSDIQIQYPDCNCIRILDDLFLKNRTSFQRAANIFSKFSYSWRAMAHIQTIANADPKDLNSIKQNGCKELFIGIESGSPRVLHRMNKTSDISVICSAVEMIFAAGINVKGYFIYGFPGENIEDMELTYQLASYIKQKSNDYRVTFRTSVFQFRPYHGTMIYSELIRRYPKIEDSSLTFNIELSQKIGRDQFNFFNENFTDIDSSVIHNYICRTFDLNDDRSSDKICHKIT
jgi:anaerobic magnesium-protoporphyrin IX monomethyl ester cyclase